MDEEEDEEGFNEDDEDHRPYDDADDDAYFND